MPNASTSHLIDEIFNSLGVWGTYQIIQLAVMFSTTWPASNQLYSIMYMGYQPPLRCRNLDNSSFIETTNNASVQPFYKTCKELFQNINRSSCPHGYEYDQPKETTIVTEWDLVCDQNYRAQLSQTALVIGQAVGATFFTIIADRFGRKRAFIISQWGMLLISTAAIFAPNIEIYSLIKFATGVMQQGHVTAFHVMPLEIMPTTMRTVPHILNGFIWSLFLCVMVAMAYICRFTSWRYLQVAITASSLITMFPCMIFLDESLRWLFANERVDEARRIIRKAIKLNKSNAGEVNAKTEICIQETELQSDHLRKRTVYLEDRQTGMSNTDTSKGIKIPVMTNGETVEKKVDIKMLSSKVDENDITPKDNNEEQGKHKNIRKSDIGSRWDIVKIRRLRITTFIMFFAWIVNSLTSFGLSLTAAKLAGDRFLNSFLISVVAIPATVVSYYTMIKLGRKKTCIIFHAIAGVFLITTVLLDTFIGESVSGVVVAFTMVGRFAISASWGTLFQYTPELYPTNFRSLGLGISSTLSRVGGMLAPFANVVIDYLPWLPGTVYGSSCLIVCFLVFFLPETFKKELPQTLDEIKEWNKNIEEPMSNKKEEVTKM